MTLLDYKGFAFFILDHDAVPTDLKDTVGNPVLRRSIASFDVTGTRVKLPAGMLQTGKFYYFQVTARAKDSNDRAAPYKEYPVHDARAEMFTGVVTP